MTRRRSAIEEELVGIHSRITIPLGKAAKGTPFEGTIPQALREFAKSLGLSRFEGTPEELRPALSQAIRAQAAQDGVDLSFTLYLPPGYKPGTPLPTVVWAYPTEYADASEIGRAHV